MKKVKRMNQQSQTADQLITAAIDLFSQHGYDGTSVRAITASAEANLGAITYHFGSKEALYDAALARVTEPIRQFVGEAASSDGSPLERIERILRGFFHHLRDNPEFPNLISHQLAGSRALPAPARDTMQKNFQTMISLITEGQADGSIRSGDARNMALSVVSQPMWLNLARRALREGAGLDQDNPDTQQQIVESVVLFVREGLRKHPEDQI